MLAGFEDFLLFIMMPVFFSTITIMGCKLIIVDLIMKKNRKQGEKLLFILAIFIIIFLLRLVLNDVVKSIAALFSRDNTSTVQTILLILLSIIGLAAIFFIFKLNLGIKINFLNRVLAILVIVSLVSLVYSVISNINRLNVSGATDNSYTGLKIEKPHNIYYIVPDSYPGKKAIETLYKIINDDFYNALEDLGFNVYHDYYSSYNGTIDSISAIFNMEHHYYSLSTKNDGIGPRRLITYDSNLLKILRNNNYSINYYHTNNYILFKGANIDFQHPKTKPFSTSLFLMNGLFLRDIGSILKPIKDLKKNVAGKMVGQTAATDSFSTLLSDKINRSNKPEFNYIHYIAGVPGHAPDSNVTNEELDNFKTKFINQLLKSTNTTLIETINLIIEKDKDAVIVLLADHGTWCLGKFLYDKANNDNFIIDKLNILCAVRWPGDYDNRYNSEFKTSINIFRYILSYLSGNELLITTRQADDGYFKTENNIYRGIKDGNIIPAEIYSGK